MSNFYFLKDKWKTLYKIGKQGEEQCFIDNNISILKSRIFSEQLTKLILIKLKKDSSNLTQYECIQLIRKEFNERHFTGALPNILDVVRLYGNKAAHEGFGNPKIAKLCLENMVKASAWLYANVTGDKSILPIKFDDSFLGTGTAASKIDVKLEEIEQDVDSLKKETEEKKKNPVQEENENKEIQNKLNLTEKETRIELIDAEIREAGWNLDDENEVKREYLIKRPGDSSLRVDYALLNEKGQVIGVIEAKRTSEDSIKGRYEGLAYVNEIEKNTGLRPVLFLTNGYDIKIIKPYDEIEKTVYGFYSREDLNRFHHKNKYSIDEVKIDENIVNRPYQIEAVNRVLANFTKKDKSLLVMATGTGKTRVSIAITKALRDSGKVTRVLFLADRKELVNQARAEKNGFDKLLGIPSIRISGSQDNKTSGEIYFATYQSMDNSYESFSTGFFDLIICDESHRSIYKHYKNMLLRFDSLILGLTATPVSNIDRSTFKFFDCEENNPTFYYSYEDAIEAKYLVPFEKISKETRFLKKGIKWNDLSEDEKEILIDEGYDEEQINFDRGDIESFVTNKDTNRIILETLMNEGIKVKDRIGKSIIFARNKNHANFLREIFIENYPQYKGKLCSIIYSGLPNVEDELLKFKNDDLPRIAISVDMLDTGIDIREMVNLVFAKPVFSNVKFWQMIGRGTRLRENLFGDNVDKEGFKVFDFWANFEFFNENPEGNKISIQKSQIQTAFERKLDLLEHFLDVKDTDNINYMVPLIKKDIYDLPLKAIDIREKRKAIDEVKKENLWKNITKSFIQKLRVDIAPLTQWIEREDSMDSRSFDSSMFKLELLKCKDKMEEYSDMVNKTKESLSFLNTSMNLFDGGKRELVNELLEDDYTHSKWLNSSFQDLEKTRVSLRDLMKNKTTIKRPFVKIDLKDTLINKDIDTNIYPNKYEEYDKRVKEELEKAIDNSLIIQKIRRGMKLSSFEEIGIGALLREHFCFSLKDLSSKSNILEDDLVGIVRYYLDVDKEYIDEVFSEYLNKYKQKLTPSQIRIVKLISDDIKKSKTLSPENLSKGAYGRICSAGFYGAFSEDNEEYKEINSIIGGFLKKTASRV